MKRIPKSIFFIVMLLILALTASAFLGVSYYNGDNEVILIKGIKDIRWGIDIRGGVEATFIPAPVMVDGKEVEKDYSDQEIDAAKAIIETRMVAASITDYELYADYNSDKIIVRFPWKSDETKFDAIAAIDEISATAKLTFREGSSEDGKELMNGSLVQDAQPGIDQSTGTSNYVVSLEFNEEGTKKFKDITTEYNGKVVSIWMDDVLLSAPTIQSVITEGRAQITGDFDADSATKLATQIRAGSLPFTLKTSGYGNIDPTLGTNALTAMAYAAIIAFIIITAFMLFFFRLPGFIALIALLGQMGLSIAAISGFFPVFNSFTMTLPGIAGIILSIGMGVDANIITAERVKEELNAGKTLDGALEKGTKSSLSAIIDGNVTIVIVSIILLLVFGPSNILSWLFGPSTTGTIYAFGFTLLMGVISNFIMGVFLSRLMLKSAAGVKFLRKKWLFGGAKK